jgi:hypothetical protein
MDERVPVARTGDVLGRRHAQQVADARAHVVGRTLGLRRVDVDRRRKLLEQVRVLRLVLEQPSFGVAQASLEASHIADGVGGGVLHLGDIGAPTED